jgi:hypothetical protein
MRTVLFSGRLLVAGSSLVLVAHDGAPHYDCGIRSVISGLPFCKAGQVARGAVVARQGGGSNTGVPAADNIGSKALVPPLLYGLLTPGVQPWQYCTLCLSEVASLPLNDVIHHATLQM